MRRLGKQFAAFSLVGAVAAVVHYGVLAFVVSRLGQRPVLGSMLGFLAGGLVSYVLNYRYTFASKQAHHVASSRFFLVAGVGFALNSALMALLTEHWSVQYLLAQLLTTAVVLCWHFFGNRHWTFREASI